LLFFVPNLAVCALWVFTLADHVGFYGQMFSLDETCLNISQLTSVWPWVGFTTGDRRSTAVTSNWDAPVY
jgi:hypothetical protein